MSCTAGRLRFTGMLRPVRPGFGGVAVRNQGLGGTADPEAVLFDMEFAEAGGEAPAPYEVLLLAAMRGEATRFTRQDGVEEAWRIMAPLIESPPPVHPYEPGTWGPP